VLDGNCGQEKVVEGEEVGRLDMCGDFNKTSLF
jgi:hypothetical protein